MSLANCGCCGKFDEKYIQKVILSGYANMLCFSCRCMLEADVESIAKRYLKDTESPKKENKSSASYQPTRFLDIKKSD